MNSVEDSVHYAKPERNSRQMTSKRVPVDPLPLAMLSPAAAAGPVDRAASDFVVVSAPPPTRVLP